MIGAGVQGHAAAVLCSVADDGDTLQRQRVVGHDRTTVFPGIADQLGIGDGKCDLGQDCTPIRGTGIAILQGNARDAAPPRTRGELKDPIGQIPVDDSGSGTGADDANGIGYVQISLLLIRATAG